MRHILSLPDFHCHLTEARYQSMNSAVCFMRNVVLISAIVLLSGCATVTPTQPNTLSRAEERAGWKLLFDGKSGTGWHSTKTDTFPEKGWAIENGTLRKIAGQRGGDLLSAETYREFDLRWDWKVAPHGNNGVKYFVTDERNGIGHEYQMLDDATEAEGKGNGKHSTASFYGVLAPWPNKVAALHPAGEWNSSRVYVKGNHVEHWLNGQKVFEYELGSQIVKDAVAHSKFKNVPHFGESVKGHILLTDHHDEATFRNIKILNLSRD
jgi:uncharacterized protein YceK